MSENHSSIAHSISCLTDAVRAHTEACKNEWERNGSRSALATKQDLQEWIERMAIKLSELGTEVTGIRTSVKKIWGEQQAKYDKLVIEFDKLKASLDNVELPEAVATDITEFKAELQAFDDTIPDVAEEPPPAERRR
jgi:regulator of replication initiation timing